jgi:ribosomal-protein-alanine N-acetyltransferase
MPGAWRPPTLTTSRLILRSVSEADADAIFDYCQSPNMTRFTLWDTHQSRDDTLKFIREYVQAHYLEHVPEPLGICQKDRPDWVIGVVGCRWNKHANHCMEMGYAIGERFWGKGLMVEAAQGLLDFVFASYDVERVQAHCMAENTASERVMQKLGMVFEGTVRSGLLHRGRFWDMRLYSILRSEHQGEARSAMR